MSSIPLRRRVVQAAGIAAVVLVLLLLTAVAVVMRSGREAEALRADLASRFDEAALRPEAERAERAELVGVARGTRRQPPVPAAAAGTASPEASATPSTASRPPVPAAAASTASPAANARPAPSALLHPSHDALFGRDPAERPIHDWLKAVRESREQPGPAPPTEVLAALGEVAPALDALAEQLSRRGVDEPAPLVEPGDRDGSVELKHARVLLLASACAESLAPSGEPVRGERLLEAAWTLIRLMPAGINDAGPGELFLAVLRQVRVADARAWDARLAQLDPRSRLISALEWDAAVRMARHESNAERRRQRKPDSLRAIALRLLDGVTTRHDAVFTTRIASAEMSLAEQVRALGPCDDPWQLSGLDAGAMKRHWPVPAGGRMRVALASASLAQADLALTRHVLLRRHGLEAPRDACGTQDLVERHLGDGRFLVGWRAPGGGEPAASARDRPRIDAPYLRTWPEPSLPGPSLDAFTFEASNPHGPVLASAPLP